MRSKTVAVALVVFTATSGCATLSPQPPNYIGTLQVSGPNVQVNGVTVGESQKIYNGDRVSTGPASSALVAFRDGGAAQLDENTDPEWQRSETGGCALSMVMDHGQVFVEAPARTKCAFRAQQKTLELVAESSFNLDARDAARTKVSVLGGQVQILRPAQVSVVMGQQVTVSATRLVATRALSPSEIKDVVAWRVSYVFPKPFNWAGAAVVGAAAAVIGALILRGLLKDHHKPPPPSSSTGSTAGPNRLPSSGSTTDYNPVK